MARVKRGVAAHKRHKRLLNRAEGRRGTRSKLVRPAREALIHALVYAYRDRRDRKRDMRRLWIERINAASRQHGLPYGRFIAGLKGAGVEVEPEDPRRHGRARARRLRGDGRDRQVLLYHLTGVRRRRSLTTPPGFRGGVVRFPR